MKSHNDDRTDRRLSAQLLLPGRSWGIMNSYMFRGLRAGYEYNEKNGPSNYPRLQVEIRWSKSRDLSEVGNQGRILITLFQKPHEYYQRKTSNIILECHNYLKIQDGSWWKFRKKVCRPLGTVPHFLLDKLVHFGFQLSVSIIVVNVGQSIDRINHSPIPPPPLGRRRFEHQNVRTPHAELRPRRTCSSSILSSANRPASRSFPHLSHFTETADFPNQSHSFPSRPRPNNCTARKQSLKTSTTPTPARSMRFRLLDAEQQLVQRVRSWSRVSTLLEMLVRAKAPAKPSTVSSSWIRSLSRPPPI